MRTRVLWILAPMMLCLAACGDDDETEAAEPPAEEPEPTPTEDEGPPTNIEEALEDPGVFVAPVAPENGCSFSDPSVVWRHAGWFDVAAGPRRFLVGGSASHGAYEMAFLAAVASGGGTSVLARTRLEEPVAEGHRRAPPALEVAGDHGALALVDGRQRLLVARFDPGDVTALRFAMVAERASLRFSPALVRHDDAWWIAWTEEQGEDGRRIFGARIPDEGDMADPQDLTPEAGGGAAPTFVAGTEPPALVFLDAREGTSVAHRVVISSSGYGTTDVARPVGLVTDPPQIAAIELGGRERLAYTGIGSAATTAVGLVPLSGTDEPSPVVPGTGYGVLHVDATPLGAGAVVVADAPIESEPTAPREIHVRVVSSSGGLSEPVVVRGPSESTTRGRVAALDDVIAVAFASDVGVHASVGRCAIPE